MSAEVLREAASLMRERAVRATGTSWVVDLTDGDEVDVRANRGAGPTVCATIPLGYERRRANAAHIASWHPDVALAVADLLDDAAAVWTNERDNAWGIWLLRFWADNADADPTATADKNAGQKWATDSADRECYAALAVALAYLNSPGG